MPCRNLSKNIPCFRFLLTAMISLIVLSFAIGMLIKDQFKTNSLSTFCCSLITSILSFWFEPPKVYDLTVDEIKKLEEKNKKLSEATLLIN